MLHILIPVLLLFSPQATPSTQPPVEPAVPAGPNYLEGPLKAEVTAVQELRRIYYEEPDKGAGESFLALQVRVRGERLPELSRIGNVILTEVMTDTGENLIKPDQYSDAEKEFMRPMSMPADRLQQTGMLLGARADLPKRGATKIPSIKGTIRAVVGSETETITILNPLQYLGDTIKDPRLEALGLTVRVLKPDALERQLPGNLFVILQFQPNMERLASVGFMNPDMRRFPAQDMTVPTKEGENAQVYIFRDESALTDALQLVLDVYPSIEEVEVPIEATDLPLP